MAKESQKHDAQKKVNDDLDKELDVLWKNWSSRRKCERTHIPRFAKNKNKEEL
ncbi:MAG: hypothetical protein ACOC4M_13425 [Promethearchaeia archaeon]